MTDTKVTIDPDIQAAFDRQMAGVTERRRNFGLSERKDALAKLADVIRNNEAAIVAALAQDFGKPETETILTEILPVLQEIKSSNLLK